MSYSSLLRSRLRIGQSNLLNERSLEISSTVFLILYRGVVGCRGALAQTYLTCSIPGEGGGAQRAPGLTYQFIKYCHLTPPTKSTGEEGSLKRPASERPIKDLIITSVKATKIFRSEGGGRAREGSLQVDEY